MSSNTHSLNLEASSSQYAYHADQAAFDLSGDCSFEIWVKLESAPSTNMFMSKWNSADGQRSWAFGLEDQYLCFMCSDGGSTAVGHYVKFYSNVAQITTGTWIHFAVTFDISSETCVMYKNGSLLASHTVEGSVGASIYNSGTIFRLGCWGNADNNPVSFFDGLKDEARIWNDIRTAQEISDNYNAELVGNEAGLAGYWKLNNDYLDETANNNDLTAVNSPVFSTDVPFVGVEKVPRHSFTNFQNPGIV